ncbi:MAG: ChaN family lipoprotein [Candidatus Rokubacteria bacterium]|nr:ChaN family lipoprotein [Candidatus Rokubacteria bacterium]
MIIEIRLLAATALLLSACAAPAGIGPASLVLALSGDSGRQAGLVAQSARGVEVLYLGEVHDNPHHHAQQRRVLEALLAEGARPVVAFEMLPAERQSTVDQALGASGGPAELDAALGWSRAGWPDFAMYWPLFEVARQHRLRVLATDLEPALVRRIAREGLAVSADGARLASLLPPDPRREAAIARSIQEGHCDLLPERAIPTMVESWHARNVAMARRLAEGPGGSPRRSGRRRRWW